MLVTWGGFGVDILRSGKKKKERPSPPYTKIETTAKKKMDSRGIEPRTTPRIEFEALCASEMLREYYTTKPRARGSSCYSFDVSSDKKRQYNQRNTYSDLLHHEDICIKSEFRWLSRPLSNFRTVCGACGAVRDPTTESSLSSRTRR